MSFDRFLIWNSGNQPSRFSGTIYVSLKEGIMANIHVESVVQKEMWFKGISDLELQQPLCSVE